MNNNQDCVYFGIEEIVAPQVVYLFSRTLFKGMLDEKTPTKGILFPYSGRGRTIYSSTKEPSPEGVNPRLPLSSRFKTSDGRKYYNIPLEGAPDGACLSYRSSKSRCRVTFTSDQSSRDNPNRWRLSFRIQEGKKSLFADILESALLSVGNTRASQRLSIASRNNQRTLDFQKKLLKLQETLE